MFLFLVVLAILVCLGLSFFFSGSEVAIVSTNRYRLRSLHEQGDASAGRLLKLLDDSQRLLVMVLIGVNLANVLLALFFRLMIQRLLGDADQLYLGFIHLSELLSLLLLTPFVIIFAEVVPKALFRAHADRLFDRLHIPFLVCLWLFRPAIALVQRTARWMMTPLAEERSRATRQLTRKDVINLITGEDREETAGADSPADSTSLGAAIQAELGGEETRLGEETDERRMIQNIIELQETRAYEIMTPLVELVAVQLGRLDLAGFKALARNSGYSRFPVYRDRIIRLVGVVDVFRVLHEEDESKRLEDFIEPAYYVPESKRVDDLLRAFLAERIKNAVVVDEFGGCVGWISREDILEEIVGELEDELDVPPRQVTEHPDGTFVVEGRTEIDALNDRLGTDFEQEEWETLAGLLLDRMGRIPQVGEEIELEGWLAHVLRMEGHRIDLVRLTRH